MQIHKFFPLIFLIFALTVVYSQLGCWQEAQWGGKCPSFSENADPDSLRLTKYGYVVGMAESTYNNHAWLGIPYAKPPVGALRWKASVEPDNWCCMEALQLCGKCTQIGDSLLGGAEREEQGMLLGNEDCLYLNIWAPRFTPRNVPKRGEQLPVMFWIHGGGNLTGWGGINSSAELAATQNVIVVMISYRLGPFGYFSHPAFRTGPSKFDRTANYATTDMIRALKWVRDNISNFGGDPGNVTIFGESAGGANVMSLIICPAARCLFHKAIVQSGGPQSSSVAEAENYVDDAEKGNEFSSREMICKFLIKDGSAVDRASAKALVATWSNDRIAAYLRSKTKEQIIDVYNNPAAKAMVRCPIITRDGYLIPKEAARTILQNIRKYNNVTML
jgi:para-nitrobenzyl esterase